MKSGFLVTSIGVAAALVLAVGQVYGLFGVPPDRHMGEVARILFVHVPVAIVSMLVFVGSLVAALGYLFTGRRGFDHMQAGALEVGTILCGLTLITGSIFARPTWGVWWTWDPRLTSSAIWFMTYVGVLMLRTLLTDSDRRALWTAVTSVVAFLNIPITYFAVNLFRSMHQMQSGSRDLDGPLRTAWQINLVGIVLLSIWMVARRARIEAARDAAEAPPELPPAHPATGVTP